jgi:isopentenyldiphosphate isomerase
VDESGGVVQVEGARSCDTFSAENGHGELLAKSTISTGWEKVCWCINVNHRHSRTGETRKRFDIYINRRETCSWFMERYKIPLVSGVGRTIGYGDRWWTHRVKDGRENPILGEKHVGITIACLDGDGRILVQHRRHRIFDKVWSLSGDTHPRKYESSKVESLSEAARRCAKEDLGVVVKNWRKILSVSYSARDPRDPRYCENELLSVLAAKHGGPVSMNRNSAYELRWAKFAEISRDSQVDSKKEPIDRKYAPWVHAMFSLPHERVEEAFLVN